MGVTPGRASRIERGGAATIDAIARHIQALRGQPGLVASVGDRTLTVATTGVMASPLTPRPQPGRDRWSDAQPGSCACPVI
jgi:hypothetical protein